MYKLAIVLVSSSILTFLALPAGAQSPEPQVTGTNAHYVKCQDDKGHAQQFSQTGDHDWSFLNKAGQSQAFTESSRDEWSIYLTNGKGMNVQLDLFKKLCVWQSPNGATSNSVTAAHTL